MNSNYHPTNPITQLENKKEELHKGGGSEKINAQHKKGKLTARERLHLIVDQDSFIETGEFVTHHCHDFNMQKQKYLGDGVITGMAMINQKKVCLFLEDFTIFGGSLSKSYAKKITDLQELALRMRCPIIGIKDSGGARIQEGVDSLAGYTSVFMQNVIASGIIPQISVIMGPCAGGAVYSPAMTDFIIMTEGSHMFLTGPNVVKSATHEDVSFEDLGGAHVHNEKSGVAHFKAEHELAAIELLKKLLSYIPSSFDEKKEDENKNHSSFHNPSIQKKLDTLMPQNANQPYDMKDVLEIIFDEASFLEIHKDYAKNILCGFAKINSETIGIVANQPNYLAGVLDNAASMKAARFVRFCDAFNIPIITFVDVPGFLPGTQEEWGGIIKNGAKLLFAYCEASVPKITIVTRKAYGGAYCVMSSKNTQSDLNLAWPTAEIAVMGPKGATEILYKKEICAAENPKEKEEELTKIYSNHFANPFVAASFGYLDRIIFPRDTRSEIAIALKYLRHKKINLPLKKHGNIPL